jgi:hypothetical protein
LIVLVLAAPAWVMADWLKVFSLNPTDFLYVEESIDAGKLARSLFVPLNTHVVPLFRIYTYAVVGLTPRLVDLPWTLLAASYLGLVATMLLSGRLVFQETGRVALAVGSMAGMGISTVMLPVLTHYAAGQALWSGAAIVAALLAASSWRHQGGKLRFAMTAAGVLAAPAVWSGGLAAGPAVAMGLWADGRPRCRRAAVVMILLTGLAAAVILLQSRRYIQTDAVVNEVHPELWPRPIQGVLHAIQSIAESTILNNLGLDAATTPLQAAVLLGLVALLWYASRGSFWRATPLEASGATVAVVGALLVYLFRGNLPFSSIRPVGWYYALPQVGMVLFAAGWWAAVSDAAAGPSSGGPLTVRGMLGVLLFVAVLCAIQIQRSAKLQIEAAPPFAPSERARFPIPELQRLRAQFLSNEESNRLQRMLTRLDRVEAIARREGIGKGDIRRVFGRVLAPGIPENHTADAASLLRLPEGETRHDPELVRRALGAWYRSEPMARPPWLEPSDPWPTGPGQVP